MPSIGQALLAQDSPFTPPPKPKLKRVKVHGSFTRGAKQEATVTFRVYPDGRPVVLEARVKHERSVLRLEFDHVVEALFARDAKARALDAGRRRG
jgi:hypothetical protein